MKALELLKIIYKDCKDWEDKGFAVIYPTNELSEAIKELEDLQSRSCKGCKHFSTGKQPDGFSWYKCEHNFECKRCFPDNFERLEK